MPRAFPIFALLSLVGAAQAQGVPPAPPPPPQQGYPGYGQQPYGGCYGCSYSGDYYANNGGARRPAPPLRLQGQWRNGWWYY